MSDVCWNQHFENYTKVLNRLSEALDAVRKEPENHLYEMATIHAFELTVQLGWKLLKEYLEFQGVKELFFPYEIIRQAFHAQLISDGQIWIEILEASQKILSAYDDIKASKIVQQIQQDFYPALKQIQADFVEKSQSY